MARRDSNMTEDIYELVEIVLTLLKKDKMMNIQMFFNETSKTYSF